ncbi:helix-turn-helix domain-containing protein [Flavobacteriaceae bacterium R38]|nr:helix-turn-helix domain-containing protein [Flavobacteriaceae bacterium R38]
MRIFNTMKCFKNVLKAVFLLVITSLTAQQLQVADSLLKKDYKVLDSLYYVHEYTEKGKLYIIAYLEKAKLEDDIEKTLIGYHLLADFYDNDYELGTQYIDSAITLASKTSFKNKSYPAALYGRKATIERFGGNFQNALYYLLKNLELANLDPNGLQMTYFNHNIGLIKRDYGDFEGAKSIFKKNLKFDRNYLKENPEDDRGFFDSSILSLHELVRTYRLNKEIDSAKILNDEGLSTGVNSIFGYLLILNDGILDYYSNDFRNSIEKITSVLPRVSNVKNRDEFEVYNLIDAYFYLGKSYEGLNDQEQKLFYYEKIDSLTEISNYLIPETKQTYLELAEHYKQLNDSEKQLKYLDKLFYIDSILDTNYKYVNDKLETDYDIPNLIRDKEILIDTLKDENVKTARTRLLVTILLSVSLFGLFFFYYRQKRYRKKFELLLAKGNEKEQEENLNLEKKQIADVSEATVAHLIASLQKFEDNERFLKTNLSLDKLAKSFKTNSKYLSIVINHIKHKNVSQYINDLRIDYVIRKLKQDSKFRKFTIKAIANEIGFNTDQAFSKAFYKKTGISPSYFIKELEKTSSLKKK